MSQAINQVIPEGYKQTDIGVIPVEWEVKTLRDITSIERGKFSARPRNDPKFFGGSIPFIQTGDITRSNGRNVTYSQTLNDKGLAVSRLFPANSLYFTIAANIGDVAIVNYQSACPDSLVVIKQKQNIDKVWLYHSLSDKKAEFEVIATSNAQLNINLEKLNPYKLSIPPKKEQTAIANALSDVDALLSELEKLIAKKQAMKTATMQQLLTGKTRLPQFAYYSDINSTEGAVDGKRKGTKPSELGEIPEDWEVKQVKEVCGFIVPGRNKPRSFSGNIPWVTTSDIDSFKSIDMSKVSLYVSREEAIFIGSKVVPKNAVIMSCVGELGIVAVVEDEIVINQQLHAFIPSNAVCSRYLAYTLTSLKEHFYSKATKTTLPYLNKDNCNSTPIALPTKNEQIAIATILSDMDNEIQTLEQRLSKTRQIKQGMMQELLTGKNRLLFENLMSKERYLNGNSVK
ncbi:MAG: restriction endonuclease subunit S [Shewanella sp.]|uniref:restriction endonuclease subunit S n=1 Tax=unclassified Shewanella TaxID=196818 RepID=UPI0021D7D2D7|nr:restriction endonuclease subunit S [Shewanella sp. SM29]MCU8075039.1 restriction endonuclease subunit S [Shewanella sp. SM29]